jgi:hypothetical protein
MLSNQKAPHLIKVIDAEVASSKPNHSFSFTLDVDDLILRDIRISHDDALGLEHVDKSSKNGRFGGAFERGIFIRG